MFLHFVKNKFGALKTLKNKVFQFALLLKNGKLSCYVCMSDTLISLVSSLQNPKMERHLFSNCNFEWFTLDFKEYSFQKF